MKGKDFEELGAGLTDRWPMKFSEPDIAAWCRAMARYPLSSVLQALDEFKNRKPYAPKVPEIEQALSAAGVQPEKPSPEDQRRFRTLTASNFVQANPQIGELQEPELVLRAHRTMFLKIREQLGTAARLRDRAINEQEERSIAGYAAGRTRECLGDLITAGVEYETAKRMAHAVSAADDDVYAEVLHATQHGQLFAHA